MIAHCIGGPANGQTWAIPEGTDEMSFAVCRPLKAYHQAAVAAANGEAMDSISMDYDVVIYKAVRDDWDELVMYSLEAVEFRPKDLPPDLPIWRA